MLNVSSRAIAVTVFTNRARITRRAEAELAAGESAVKLAGLPMSMEPDSVRVTARGNARIVSVDVSSDFFAETPEASVAALEQQLETLTEQLRAVDDADQAQSNRMDMAKSLAAASSAELAKGIAFGRAGIDQARSLREYVVREQEESAILRRGLGLQRDALNRLIEAVRGQLKRVRQPARQERRAIVVTVDAAEPGTLVFEATYIVNNAQWSPLYDLRLRDEKVAVTYLASVTQHTGEEWTGVDLSLSTAQPAVTSRIPELSPWYVEPFTPPPTLLRSEPMAGGVSLKRRRLRDQEGGPESDEAAGMDLFAAVPFAAPLVARVETGAGGASVTYRCERPATIAGDGSTHRPLIAQFELPAKLDHVTAPKIAEEAYLRATIANASEYVLLAGPGSVFHDDEYVSKTGINLTARNEEIKLQLGVDARVKVKRELVSRDTSKTFLIGNTRKIELGYKIELQNLTGRVASVVVEDQVPHSRHEEIKVKPGTMSPKPAEVTDLGIVRWKLSLRPDEKAEVRFEFLLEHPRQMELEGFGV